VYTEEICKNTSEIPAVDAPCLLILFHSSDSKRIKVNVCELRSTITFNKNPQTHTNFDLIWIKFRTHDEWMTLDDLIQERPEMFRQPLLVNSHRKELKTSGKAGNSGFRTIEFFNYRT
jgi:hypothetical protein